MIDSLTSQVVGPGRWHGECLHSAPVSYARDRGALRPGGSEERARAQLAIALLRGTLASLRCRNLMDRGAWAEAKVELLLLQEALGVVDRLVLDRESVMERDLLRTSERRLEARLNDYDASKLGAKT